ncbi:MAG: heme-degrading domain-containing protein [Pseudomonadota bacterium]
MEVKELLAKVERHERELVFEAFDEDAGWQLGSLIRETARTNSWPLAIEIAFFHRRLFAAALAGSTSDNFEWLRRKCNVVRHFERSSYRVGLEMQLKQSSLADRYGLSRADYAEHGGAFPISVRGIGVVGCVAVSGLPQQDDHMLVVRSICQMLARDVTGYAL